MTAKDLYLCPNEIHYTGKTRYHDLAGMDHFHRDLNELTLCLTSEEGLSSLEEEAYEQGDWSPLEGLDLLI